MLDYISRKCFWCLLKYFDKFFDFYMIKYITVLILKLLVNILRNSGDFQGHVVETMSRQKRDIIFFYKSHLKVLQKKVRKWCGF